MTTAAAQRTDTARWRRLARRSDLLALACFLVASIVYALQGFDGILKRDPAVYLYAGQRVADGSLPYVDVINRTGPLAHAIPGLGVAVGRLVGADDVHAVRFLFMLISAGTVAAVYVLGRDLCRSRAAGVLAGACMLTFEGFSIYATFGPREKTAMVLFATWALVALVRQRWFAAGVVIALATLTWQPVLVALLLAAVGAISLGVPVRRWWRPVLGITVGGAVPTALTILVYAVGGQLRVLLDCFLLLNARYTSQGSPLDDPALFWRRVVAGYGWSVWLFVLGLGAAVVLAALAIVRRGGADRAGRAGHLALGAFVVGGVCWSLRAFNYWPDAMLLLPPAAVAVAATLVLLLRPAPRRARLVVTGSLTVAGVVAALAFALGHRLTGLDDQQAAADAVTRVVPGATILTVEAPQPLVFERAQNPTRFLLYGNGLRDYIVDTVDGGIPAYVDDLREHRPTAIGIGTAPQHPWTKRLTRGYEPVGGSAGWVWWVDADLPAPQRVAIKAAISAAKR